MYQTSHKIARRYSSINVLEKYCFYHKKKMNPEFSRRGRQPQPIILGIFSPKLNENEKDWTGTQPTWIRQWFKCIVIFTLFKLPSQYLDTQSSQKFSKWCSNLALQEREVLWQAFSTPLVKPGGPQLNTPTVRTLKLDLLFSVNVF